MGKSMYARPSWAATTGPMCGNRSAQLALLSPASWQQVQVWSPTVQIISMIGASSSSMSALLSPTVTRRTGCTLLVLVVTGQGYSSTFAGRPLGRAGQVQLRQIVRARSLLSLRGPFRRDRGRCGVVRLPRVGRVAAVP